MRFAHFLTRLIAASALFAVVGCDGQPATYPVTGIVTYKGEPVEGATVSFAPDDPENKSAGGVTDSEGRYSLTTFTKDDGAMVGSYNVRVTKYDEPPVESATATDSEQTDELPDDYEPESYEEAGPPQNELPAKYGKIGGTPLSFTVEAIESNVYDINLE